MRILSALGDNVIYLIFYLSYGCHWLLLLHAGVVRGGTFGKHSHSSLLSTGRQQGKKTKMKPDNNR